MSKEAEGRAAGESIWQARHVYGMAVFFLLLGLGIGYFFRGSQSPARAITAVANVPPPKPANAMARHTPSLDEMKQMADKKAAPLLEKLNADPNNSDLLMQLGNLYKATHQFKQAAVYYEKGLHIKSRDVAIRNELASCLFYEGDADGAIQQLQQSLQYEPQDANSLFNLGMIKWQAKQDSKGALQAWRELLKLNPQMSADRKATVQKLMADVQSKTKT